MKARETIPILRIFDREKALEFYRDYLGFEVDWEHRYEPDGARIALRAADRPVRQQASSG